MTVNLYHCIEDRQRYDDDAMGIFLFFRVVEKPVCTILLSFHTVESSVVVCLIFATDDGANRRHQDCKLLCIFRGSLS